MKEKKFPVTIENIVNVPELKDGSGLIHGVGWTVAPSQDLGMAWNERETWQGWGAWQRMHEMSWRFCINWLWSNLFPHGEGERQQVLLWCVFYFRRWGRERRGGLRVSWVGSHTASGFWRFESMLYKNLCDYQKSIGSTLQNNACLVVWTD